MTSFSGFPEKLPAFLAQLRAHNTREWFQAHKDDYEAHVKIPSQQFVSAMGERLSKLCPGINAIPKVNQSLFRINRDTRFSNDKSPYKTNLGILFWDGPGKRMESSGFYFHMEEDFLMLGCGLHIFPRHIIPVFRDAVVGQKISSAIEKAAIQLSDSGYRLGTKTYKRIPKGCEPVNAFQKELILFSGLTARIELDLPVTCFSPDIIDFTMTHFEAMIPLHRWIMENLCNKF